MAEEDRSVAVWCEDFLRISITLSPLPFMIKVNHGGMKTTHCLMRNEGWVRWHPQRLAEISISYCDENCVSVNGCCRNYLPRVTCDSITQQIMWWGLAHLRMAAGDAAAAAKSLQSCPTLCDPIGSSPPGSPIPGILQARTLEWVAISFSNAWKWKVKVKSLSCVRLSNPMDCSPPGSSVHGSFQARVLEWGAIAFSSCRSTYSLLNSMQSQGCCK